MNIKESIQQIETLIEAWRLDEADLNQTDINAMQVLLKENKQLKENWNKLWQYILEKDNRGYEKVYTDDILDKMQELEQGSDK